MTAHIPVQLQEQDDKTWISPTEAARILDIAEGTLKGYIQQGKFQRIGTGSGVRLHLGDVREYASRRDPNRVSGGKKRQQIRAAIALAISSEESKDLEAVQLGPFEVALKAREELFALNDRLTMLLTRKSELEEVVRAVEKIEQFARLTTEEI